MKTKTQPQWTYDGIIVFIILIGRVVSTAVDHHVSTEFI